MRRIFGIAIAVTALLSLTIGGVSAHHKDGHASAAGGVSGPAFYVDGELYRTVGTPTDFSNTGAPDHSFDIIYQLFGAQDYNVATAAPGDAGYNGGRWMVHGITFDDYDAALAAYDDNGSGDFDSDEEVEMALAGGIGEAEDIGIVAQFECPVIPMPGGPNR